MNIDLNVSVGRNMEWLSSDDIRCTLEISSQLRTYLTVSSSMGAVNVTTVEGVTLAGAELRASAGAVKMNMTQGTTLDGPLVMDTSLGGLELEWRDLRATANASIDLKASAGGIRLIVLQEKDLGDDLAVRSAASLGGIDLGVDIKGNTSARVQSHAELGGIRVDGRSGFNGTDEDLASMNYPSSSRMEISSTANAGGVNIRLSYTS